MDIIDKITKKQQNKRKLFNEMIEQFEIELLQQTDKQKTFDKRTKEFGIEIIIQDLNHPHTKGRSDWKKIEITSIGGNIQGTWTVDDIKKTLYVWNELLNFLCHTLDEKYIREAIEGDRAIQ